MYRLYSSLDSRKCERANIFGGSFPSWDAYCTYGEYAMIVVSNRVQIPENRVETFVDRLRTSHDVEDQPGFQGLKLLSPVDAEGYITMTFWDSREAYEAWREGTAFERAHNDSEADQAFERPNKVEIHKVIVEREPADDAPSS